MECYERTCCVIGLGYLGCRNGAGQGVLEYVFCSNHLRFLERVFGCRKTNADCGVGMKTPEDEAFDDLAKRQGAWGGGFPAKRKMAADKMQEPVCDKNPQGCWNVRCQLGKQCKNLAQPAQEPKDIAKLVEGMEVSVDVSTGEHDSGNRLFGTVTLAQENQSSKHGLILLVQEPEPNFKKTTPPQREWVGLTEQERNNIENDFSVVISIHVFDAIEAKLKKKNNETTN